MLKYWPERTNTTVTKWIIVKVYFVDFWFHYYSTFNSTFLAPTVFFSSFSYFAEEGSFCVSATPVKLITNIPEKVKQQLTCSVTQIPYLLISLNLKLYLSIKFGQTGKSLRSRLGEHRAML